jgi:hypothetical protein
VLKRTDRSLTSRKLLNLISPLDPELHKAYLPTYSPQ